MNTSRYITITLIKIFLVILLMLILFCAGLMIGYGILGSGRMMDVFQMETWRHIVDFIK